MAMFIRSTSGVWQAVTDTNNNIVYYFCASENKPEGIQDKHFFVTYFPSQLHSPLQSGFA